MIANSLLNVFPFSVAPGYQRRIIVRVLSISKLNLHSQQRHDIVHRLSATVVLGPWFDDAKSLLYIGLNITNVRFQLRILGCDGKSNHA